MTENVEVPIPALEAAVEAAQELPEDALLEEVAAVAATAAWPHAAVRNVEADRNAAAAVFSEALRKIADEYEHQARAYARELRQRANALTPPPAPVGERVDIDDGNASS